MEKNVISDKYPNFVPHHQVLQQPERGREEGAAPVCAAAKARLSRARNRQAGPGDDAGATKLPRGKTTA